MLDYEPLLRAVIEERCRGRDPGEIARAFHRGLAAGLCAAIRTLCESEGCAIVVASGGVFQNEVLTDDVRDLLSPSPLRIWTHHEVPPNDGGISLGQAALAAGEDHST